MYTTTQVDNEILNNYAIEPEMTYAEYPSLYQQRRYIQQGAIAALLVSVLIMVSAVIS